ncbi:MAG TPA: hypothetical protein VL402_12950 [Xanthobacteraceae bacterium]|jgi:hypothetical protein|nr:hypothetical protein [Xanthobacteraceae bacterium]
MNVLSQKTFERLVIAGIVMLVVALVVVVRSEPPPPHMALDLPQPSAPQTTGSIDPHPSTK